MYQFYDDPAASVMVKLRTLQWAGHIERIDDKRTPNRVFKGTPEGHRLVGKSANGADLKIQAAEIELKDAIEG